MSSQHEDAVLSLDSSSSDFEGFDKDDIITPGPCIGAEIEVGNSISLNKPKKLKSVVKKANKKVKPVSNANNKKHDKKNKKAGLLDKLSERDIEILKGKLGLDNVDKENSQSFANIEVNWSENENCNDYESQRPDKNELEKALFGDSDDNESEEDEWNLPQTYITEKGPSIDKSLAKLVNSACTTQSNVSDIIASYKIPDNCELLSPPSVNLDVWKILGKRGQTNDRLLVDIQNIVAAEMVAIVKLASVLKQHITGNKEAKGILSDLITLTGQTQFSLSLRRRHMCRPYLDKKYSGLCNINVPLTTHLFGDDIAKEVKNCEAGFSLARERFGNYGAQRPFRGRQSSFRSRRPGRFQPYGQRQYGNNPQTGQYGQPYRRGFRSRASATNSRAPN